jgi:hypothetical protein
MKRLRYVRIGGKWFCGFAHFLWYSVCCGFVQQYKNALQITVAHPFRRPDEVIFFKKKLYGIGEPAQYASTKLADAI